jgi:hypothetical protein
MHPTRLVWTESAEDRLTGGYPGSRIVAHVFVVVLLCGSWLCCVALALLVPDAVIAWVLVWVLTLGFAAGGIAAAAFGGRRGQRRWIARLRTEFPHAVLISCVPVDGISWALGRLARDTGNGAGRRHLLVAGFVLAVDEQRISFVSRQRSMVIPTSDLDRIRRGTATIWRGQAPALNRSTIDLEFTAGDGELIVVQLCPIPIEQEQRHYFRPTELGVIAATIDLALRG